MKLRFTSRATEDIKATADYIRDRNPAAALRVRVTIYGILGRLIQFPRLGRSQREPGVRKVIARFGYIIYYLDDVEKEVVILSVQHPAQDRDYDDA